MLILLSLVLVALLPTSVTAQLEDPPIIPGQFPEHLVADFGYPKITADEFYLLGGQIDAGDHLFVKVELAYENSPEAKSILIGYRFAQPVGPPGFTLDTHSTSFYPTAVSKAQGRGNAFFVAGWNMRTDRVVIEKWRIGPVSVSQVALDANGKFIPPTMDAPTITKEQVYSSPRDSQAQPIEGLAYNPVSDQLFVLMYGSSGQIFVLDLGAPGAPPSLLVDASMFQQLSNASSLKSYYHEAGGLLITANDHTAWGSYESMPPTQRGRLVIPDGDLDGSPDVALIDYLDNAELKSSYPGSGWRRSWAIP